MGQRQGSEHSRFQHMYDTPPDINERVRDAVLRQSPIDRLRATLALSESMREIALAGLRARYPGKSTLELVEVMTGESMTPTVRRGPAIPR